MQAGMYDDLPKAIALLALLTVLAAGSCGYCVRPAIDAIGISVTVTPEENTQ